MVNEPGQLASALAEAERHSARAQALDERLELVLAASRTGLWEWEIGTGRLEWSDQILLLHGLERGEAPPDFETYLSMVHEDDRTTFVSRVRAALENREPYSLEFRILRRDGSVHWTHGAGRAFYDEAGQPIRMIGTGQDITERKRLEEVERRANEWRQAFVDVISHELRTPIATILGTAAVLGRPGGSADPATREELLREIASDAERLERIVQDLVVLSRAERGVLDAAREPIHLARVVEATVETEGRRWPGMTFEIEVEPGIAVASGEETAIRQVLTNLIGNAAKYGRPGGRIITTVSASDEGLVVRVADDGDGLGDADPERLFDLFYRAPSQVGRAAGSGIGLFVCARLVEAMGGRIWGASLPGGGSEFGFTVPALDDSLLDAEDADAAGEGVLQAL